MLSLPLPSAPWLPWLLRHRHRCGAAGSVPRLAGLLPSRLRGEGTSSFLSGTNEIFLLLCAPLGSGSVFYPLGLALCSSPVITAHTSSQTGLALRGVGSSAPPPPGGSPGDCWGEFSSSSSSPVSLASTHMMAPNTYTQDSYPSLCSICPNPSPLSWIHSRYTSPRKPSLIYHNACFCIQRSLMLPAAAQFPEHLTPVTGLSSS